MKGLSLPADENAALVAYVRKLIRPGVADRVVWPLHPPRVHKNLEESR